MSRIVIIGGHGKIALLASPLLVAAGHTVDSVIRNADQIDDVAATGATPVIADIENLDTAAIATFLSDHDVVIWSAGAGGGDPARTYAVDRDAAIRTIDAAAAAQVSRFVLVSYFGASLNHGVPKDNSFFAYAEAKAEADEHLRQSALDWTILAPSTLTNDDPTGAISLTDETSESVPRADVAAVIAAVVDAPSTQNQFVRFNSGDTPISQAFS